MAVSSAEQIEQAADELENRNKADDRHMEAPRFASATPPPTSRGTEALERLSNLEARVEEQERAIRRMLSLLIEWVDRKSVVSGKSVSVRVDLGGRRNIKKKKQ